MRSDRERLLDILEAIERIEMQAARGRSTFAAEELAQAAVIRWIEIIGEAARGSPTNFGRHIPRCRGGEWSQ